MVKLYFENGLKYMSGIEKIKCDLYFEIAKSENECDYKVEIIEKGPDLLPIIVAGIVLLAGASVVTYIIIKKIT